MNRGKAPQKMLANSSGFTFIELVVVLVITSVLLGIVSPQLSGFYKRIKVDSAARQMKYFLDYANEVALSEKKTCRITVGSGWRGFTLFVRKDGEKTEEFIRVETGLHSYEVMQDLEIDAIEKDKKGIAAGSEVNIDVFPLFTPQEILFSLKDSAGNQAKVKIEAGSGKVVIL